MACIESTNDAKIQPSLFQWVSLGASTQHLPSTIALPATDPASQRHHPAQRPTGTFAAPRYPHRSRFLEPRRRRPCLAALLCHVCLERRRFTPASRCWGRRNLPGFAAQGFPIAASANKTHSANIQHKHVGCIGHTIYTTKGRVNTDLLATQRYGRRLRTQYGSRKIPQMIKPSTRKLSCAAFFSAGQAHTWHRMAKSYSPSDTGRNVAIVLVRDLL